MKNTNRRFWLALIIFSLTGQIAWVVENMYFNVFIYKMFNASAADIALMVQASAVAATLTTILIGALSDRLGKRKIFMCAGYIAWGISILAFAFIREDLIGSLFGMTVGAASACISIVIIMDCVMTFFGSTANDAAYNAWLTDSTTEKNRGAAEGINAMMPLVAILVVFGGFMGFDLSKAESWTVIYTVKGAAVFLIGILGFFIVDAYGIIGLNSKDSTDKGFLKLSPILFSPQKRLMVDLRRKHAQNEDLSAKRSAACNFGSTVSDVVPSHLLQRQSAEHTPDVDLHRSTVRYPKDVSLACAA